MRHKNCFKFRKGITLIELLFVIPMISIILLLIFNMFFLINRSFKYASDSFIVAEDIRNFTNTIQKEANQAKKANDNTALYKPDNSGNNELYIYTDVNGDDIPELVRYRVKEGKIIRDIKEATNNKFPLKYESTFKNEKVVLNLVTNKGIFGDIERVEVHDKYTDENDHRRKVKMTIEIKADEEDSPIIIDTLLIVKSRTQYED